jgi:hypothetical protein
MPIKRFIVRKKVPIKLKSKVEKSLFPPPQNKKQNKELHVLLDEGLK